MDFTLDATQVPEYDLEFVEKLTGQADLVTLFMGADLIEKSVRRTLAPTGGEFPIQPELVRGFLRYAELMGIDWLPRWRRTDSQGRDYFSYLEGPLLGAYAPAHVVSQKTAHGIGSLQASLHNLGATYDGPGKVEGAVGPCHFDFGAGNLVVLDGAKLGIIDNQYLSYGGFESGTGRIVSWQEDVTTSIRQLYVTRRFELSTRAIARQAAAFIDGYNSVTTGPHFNVTEMIDHMFHDVGRSFLFINEAGWHADHPGKYDVTFMKLHSMLDWLQANGGELQESTQAELHRRVTHGL